MKRNILSIEEVINKKDFIPWFIMNCFPEGLDEANDMSIYDVIVENYSFNVEWYNQLTNYYDGVFDEGDGYVDNPNAISIPLNNNELLIEFHPGDVLFYMNAIEIGRTGPDYNIGVISFNEYIDLTRDLSYETKLFLLPMVGVKECDMLQFREIVESIIGYFEILKSCKKQIVEITMNNCLIKGEIS